MIKKHKSSNQVWKTCKALDIFELCKYDLRAFEKAKVLSEYHLTFDCVPHTHSYMSVLDILPKILSLLELILM